MRNENNTQLPPLYLHFFVQKNIMVNFVTKNNKSLKVSNIKK